MKATELRHYRKGGTGNLVFVHVIDGTPEEIADYEKSQGENLRHDEESKKPLMFTNRAFPKKVNTVIKTRSGRYIIDNSDMDRAAALTAQYGGNPGQVIGQLMFGQLLGGNTGAPATAQVPQGEQTLTNP